jgi:hypothetical protein
LKSIHQLHGLQSTGIILFLVDDDEEVMEDEQYNEYVGEQLGYLLPEGGHRVLVVQPGK